MAKAIVADDNATVRRRLVRVLDVVWPELEVFEAGDGIDAWDAFLEHEPAVCFLDVRMPGLTAIELVQRLDDRAQIVFLAEPNDLALQTFEAAAAMYLVKPLEDGQIAAVVARVQASLTCEQQVRLPSLQPLFVKLAHQLRRPAPLQVLEAGNVLVPVERIVCLQADAHRTRVISTETELLLPTPLKQLVVQLDPAVFLQINRFAVVNRQHILASRRLSDGTMVVSLRAQDRWLQVARHFQPSLVGGDARHAAA